MSTPERTLARRVAIWTVVGVALLSGLFWLFVYVTNTEYEQAIAQFEQLVGSAKHGDYVESGVRRLDNQAVAFPAAMKDSAFDPGRIEPIAPQVWGLSERSEAAAVLKRSQGTLLKLHQAAKLPSCAWPGPATENGENAWSASVLRAAQLLRLEGYRAVDAGDPEGVESSLTALTTLANCLYRQPNLAGSLVATAVDRVRLQVIHSLAASAADGEILTFAEKNLTETLRADRVSFALRAEGAFALHFVENPDFRAGGRPRFGPVYPIFARRVASELARRWIDLSAWADQPLEELLDDRDTSGLETQPGGTTTVIANILIPNIREAVVRMRTNERLCRLALVAMTLRRQGVTAGSYSVDSMSEFSLTRIPQPDGSLILLDTDLESRLRQRYESDGNSAPGIESTLALTTWRLPPV